MKADHARLPVARWAAPIAALLLLAAPAAPAQQTYRLGSGGWQKQAAPPPDSPAGKLQTIRKRIVEDAPGEAQDLAEAWLAEQPRDHELRPEARLLLGDAKAAQGNFYQALFDYEVLARQYPESDQFMTALRREYRIALRFTGGLNRKFLGLRIVPAEAEGEELFIRIQERAPGSRIGEKASLALGNYYYRNGQMDLASEAYDLFLINYPRSLQRQWAMHRLIQASLAQFEGPPYDPTGLLEARQRLETYINEYPASAEQIGANALRVRINESLARTDLRTARWYEGQDERLSAIVLYRRLVQEYPQTAAARTALDRLEGLRDPLIDERALPTGADSAGGSDNSDQEGAS